MAIPTLVFLALLAFQQQPDFVCPMDPDVHSKGPGKCTKCGMALEARIIEPVEYPTSFKYDAPHLAIKVKDPKTAAPVREFEVVHERLMHLFVVSSDLGYFAHIHPEVDGGTAKIDLELPKPGNYKLGADFYPKGGAPQFIEHFLTTPGYNTPVSQSLGRLSEDFGIQSGENLKVSLKIEPETPIPGKKTLMFFRLEPADGLEQYLGAWAHALVVSEDLIDMAHTHPMYADGGPDVQFDVFFPRAGMYKVWVQFQRLGKVNTVAFTVPVRELK